MAGFWVQSLAGVGTWGNQLMFLSPSPSCLLSLKINKIFLKTDCLKLFSSFILFYYIFQIQAEVYLEVTE